jgi:hypothetical protein
VSMSVITVNGANSNARCSKVGHYCSPVSLRRTSYQRNVGDMVGDVDSLSDVEHGGRY